MRASAKLPIGISRLIAMPVGSAELICLVWRKLF